MNKNISIFNLWAKDGRDEKMEKNHTDSVNKMINIIKPLIIERRTAFSWQEIASYSFVIFLVAFFIAPRFWEPGGETFRSWAVAQLSRQTLEFSNIHAPQLYNLYLQLFLFLDYPLSIQLEHFVTHLFCTVSLFLLLSRFLPRVPALIIVCAWIPQLWVIETGARVAAIGFFALYLSSNRNSSLLKGKRLKNYVHKIILNLR